MSDNNYKFYYLGCLVLTVQFAALAMPDLVGVILACLFGWIIFSASVLRLLWTYATFLAGGYMTVAIMKMLG